MNIKNPRLRTPGLKPVMRLSDLEVLVIFKTTLPLLSIVTPNVIRQTEDPCNIIVGDSCDASRFTEECCQDFGMFLVCDNGVVENHFCPEFGDLHPSH